MVLAYLGKDGRAANPADYPAAVEALQQVRPFFATFDNTNYINALPNGELCAVASWSGDYATAAARAEEAGVEIDLEYFVPATGAPAWADCMSIPADAPHPENAHAFLEYLLEPEVIAACTNYVNYANGNAASKPFVDPAILGEPVDLSRRGDGEADVGAAGLDPGAGPRPGAGLDRGPDGLTRRARRPGRLPARLRPGRGGEQALRRLHRRRRGVARGRQGRALRAARRLRLRQDHAPADARRLRDAERRAHLHRRPGHDRRAGPCPAGQHDVPVLRALPAHDRRAERRLRPDATRRCRRSSAATGSARCSTSCSSAASAAASRTRSPAASASASRSPARSPRRRSSCSSTSRWPRSTRSCASTPSSSSRASSTAPASPSSSSPTTRRRR